MRRRHRRRALALGVTIGLGLATLGAGSASADPRQPRPDGGCRLTANGRTVQHVISLQFDNVHLTRDNPDVPSDLEQMPHLLDFLQRQGTLSGNHHTPLIAHTGDDILTSLTGLYGDRHGQPVSNSYRYYKPDGTTGSASSFAYWTDGVADTSVPAPTDTAPTMVGPDGRIAPAPWAAYTKAGCDVGSVSAANTVLENTTVDIDKVFGKDSPQAAEAKADPARAQADYVGIGIHCGRGSRLCAGGATSPDLLPDEPGGYQGYRALFGAKAVDPVISASGAVASTAGRPITDPKGNPGFPGFDAMTADNSLGYVAQMQEAGVPVTYAYIADAHDRHGAQGGAYGPGEAGYVSQLKAYDEAFAAFFDRLARDGITADNTLFVVTSDENDHFVGGKPTPAGCDGVTVPCSYQQIGEVNVNSRGLLATQQGVTTPYTLHADSAPTFYLDGRPGPDDPATRALERAWARTTAVNPISGQREKISAYLADQAEMKVLHMVTGDPLRTPTFTSFAKPDYYVTTGGPDCSRPCVYLGPAYAWNHGDFSADIDTTWLGLAGPGVRHLGRDDRVWSDHTDIRPTVLALTGLRDPYLHDGRVLTEFLKPGALHGALTCRGHGYRQLAAAYKQLNAGVGEFAAATLRASTAGVESDTPGDTAYRASEARLTALGTERDRLAGQIARVLDRAAFGDGRLDPSQARALTAQAEDLIAQARRLG